MIHFDFDKVTRVIQLPLLVALFTLATGSISFAQEPFQRQVQKFETPELGIANPAGLAFSPRANALLVARSGDTSELMSLSFAKDVDGPAIAATAIDDPLQMTFDGKFNSLLFWDASANELVEIKADANGLPRTSQGAITRFDARGLGIKGAKGMTVDPRTGNLFVLVAPAKPAVPGIVRITPDRRDRFSNPEVSGNALKSLQNVELRGIAFNPSDGHLYVMAPGRQKLYELS